jgi:hypothetical protein
MESTTATEEKPMDVVEAPAPQSDTLTAKDRCDRCNAQAYVSVLLGESELLFCGHDYAEAEAKLTALNAVVVDERYKLFKTTKLDVSA